MRRFVRIALWSLVVLVALLAALFSYFVYAPAPEVPRLSGKLSTGTIEAGGLKRSYLLYVPRGLPKGAPLVMVMHGSGESAARMRAATGYGFERLADAKGFAVVYPNGFEGYWNACNIVGDYAANTRNIDDVGFLTKLADALATGIGIDTRRVFATGISRGGHMAFRLALEAPTRFRAVAAIAANVPAPENFKCKPAGGVTSSVMIMNGTQDPLNPFEGGEVRLFGLFVSRGKVLSSRESAAYFANRNHLAGPATHMTGMADAVSVEDVLWRGPIEVELVAIHGGGHVVPQPYVRYPRILGPTPKEPDGPAVIWEFFTRQHITN